MAGDLLDGLKTQVGDRYANLASNPVAIVGTDANGNVVNLGAAGGGLSPGSPVGTYVQFHVSNSGTLSGGIPATAKRWAVNFVGTGTANTFGTNTAVTGGQGFSDNGVPSVAIAIVCDGSTVADGFYSTT